MSGGQKGVILTHRQEGHFKGKRRRKGAFLQNLGPLMVSLRLQNSFITIEIKKNKAQCELFYIFFLAFPQILGETPNSHWTHCFSALLHRD